MSLLDPIVVLDAVLETMMQQEIVLANRTDSAAGAGTALNPFNAGGANTNSDQPFDQIMRALSSSVTPVTVRLLPGTYYTRGFPTSGSQGWRPFSGLRLVGSGQFNTTLVRCGTAASGHNAVIGNSHTTTSEFIDALEISDLTVDVAHSTATSTAALSGIAVSGRSIHIERVRVKNMGNNASASVPAFGISIARAHSSAPYMPENCVVNECAVDTPGAAAVGTLFGLHLSSETEGMFHQFCVVRNCLVDLNDGPSYTKGYTGIAAGGGLGTIIEHSRLFNCKYAVGFPNLLSTRDLIIRHNYLRLPQNGILLNMTGAGSAKVGRVIVINNLIEWPGVSEYNSAVAGITTNGATGTFEKLAIRDNMIRRWIDEPRSDDVGVNLLGWAEAVVDNNLIDVATVSNAVRHTAPSHKLSAFNNLKSDGSLCCPWNTDTATFDQELETEAQDIDMMLFK